MPDVKVQLYGGSIVDVSHRAKIANVHNEPWFKIFEKQQTCVHSKRHTFYRSLFSQIEVCKACGAAIIDTGAPEP